MTCTSCIIRLRSCLIILSQTLLFLCDELDLDLSGHSFILTDLILVTAVAKSVRTRLVLRADSISATSICHCATYITF